MAEEIDPSDRVQINEVLKRLTTSPEMDMATWKFVIESVEDNLPRTSELLNILKDLWDHFQSVELPSIPDRPHVEVVAAAWIATIYRQSHAIAILAESGLNDTIASNARVALEHALYLSALTDQNDQLQILDAIEYRFRYTWKSLSNKAEAMDYQDFAIPITQMLGMFPELGIPKTMGWVNSLEQLCNRLQTGQLVYLHYQFISSLVHPGLVSAGPHVLKSFSDNSLTAPPINLGFLESLELAIYACLWAGWAADVIFDCEVFADAMTKGASFLDAVPLHRLK